MRFFHKIHLWLSVPFGIIITVICFSGAMLVFEPEITRSLRRDVYYVASVESRPVDLGELMESVKATLPDSVSITGVTVFNDRERTYQVNLSKPRRAALFVDQYSGEITGRYERMAFFFHNVPPSPLASGQRQPAWRWNESRKTGGRHIHAYICNRPCYRSDYMVAAGEEKFSSQPVHFI